jgi:hypothetical protein
MNARMDRSFCGSLQAPWRLGGNAVGALRALSGSQAVNVELLLAEDKIDQYTSALAGALTWSVRSK